MLWAREYYQEYPAAKFIKHLDLSEGQRLFALCNTVCDWYGEIIANRKHFIHYAISEILESENSPWQIVILAAGMCPLSLNLLAIKNQKIINIFEIDECGMEEKGKMYNEIFPQYARKIKCISSSINEKRMMDVLAGVGYRKELQTIVLAEGISYYISKRRLKDIIQQFATGSKRNIFVLEYLIPSDDIPDKNRKISDKIFNIIKKECDLAKIFRYTKSELERIFIQCGGNLLRHETMSGMESLRKKSNQYFKRQNEGWIECIVGRL
jgi:O-methyltransferase involved in polyketide biosynthesis